MQAREVLQLQLERGEGVDHGRMLGLEGRQRVGALLDLSVKRLREEMREVGEEGVFFRIAWDRRSRGRSVGDGHREGNVKRRIEQVRRRWRLRRQWTLLLLLLLDLW